MAKINYYLKRPVEALTYAFCSWRVKKMAKKYFQIGVEGLENLPAESAIIVPNHEIGIDSGLLGITMPRKIHYLVQKEGVYDSRATMLLWALGQIPVNVRGGSNREVVKRAGDYLNYSRDFLGIFGEGPSMNLDVGGEPLPVLKREYQAGAAHFAINKRKEIIPVALVTREEIVRNFWNFPWNEQEEKFRDLGKYVKEKGKVPYRVCVGKPLWCEQKRELTARVKEEICRMYYLAKSKL
jgi:1-acyl-sn-glycerol-3-phosphate acyltransferase